MKRYYTYILASKRNGTLYTGVTGNLIVRTWQHQKEETESFTQKYHVHLLVWYEVFDNVYDAITAEKRIKKWKRGWKLNLIEKNNPEWRDLYEDILS